MGILNLTADSFSDGGELLRDSKVDLAAVVDRAARMVDAGAAFLDVGAESTRPGAKGVTSEQELARVVPVVELLVQRFDVVVSVDTSNPAVITAAASAGAGLINDVRALTTHGALDAVVAASLPVCLMHMQGEPATMQQAPSYHDVVGEVAAFLRKRINACMSAGIAKERLLIDPGFGFGKSLEHNLQLLAQLKALRGLQVPLLVGLSRKRMLGALTGKPEREREAAGIAAALLAIHNGACIVRTHDVAGMVDAVKVWQAVAAYH